MNKTLIFLITLLTSINLIAQDGKLTINKGTFLIGGQGQINNNKSTFGFSGFEQERESSIVILGIDAGYALSDNLILGINANYSNTKIISSDTQLTGLGIFAKKYWGIGKKTALFLRANGLYSFGKSSEIDISTGGIDSNNRSDINSLSFSLQPGFTYFISSKMALELSIATLSYSTFKRENKQLQTESISNTFDLNYNLSNVAVGLNFYL